jgi:O-methyltransferase
MTEQPSSVVGENDRNTLLELAKQAPLGGCFVEVGVYKGGTAWYLAKEAKARKVRLYLYDTFEGMPFQDILNGDEHKPGDFGGTSFKEVKRSVPYATLIKGVFPESLIPMGNISFVHCDVDQYHSTRWVLLTLFPQLLNGGIILVDDYTALKSATKATDELFDITELTSGAKAVIRKGSTRIIDSAWTKESAKPHIFGQVNIS